MPVTKNQFTIVSLLIATAVCAAAFGIIRLAGDIYGGCVVFLIGCIVAQIVVCSAVLRRLGFRRWPAAGISLVVFVQFCLPWAVATLYLFLLLAGGQTILIDLGTDVDPFLVARSMLTPYEFESGGFFTIGWLLLLLPAIFGAALANRAVLRRVEFDRWAIAVLTCLLSAQFVLAWLALPSIIAGLPELIPVFAPVSQAAPPPYLAPPSSTPPGPPPTSGEPVPSK